MDDDLRDWRKSARCGNSFSCVEVGQSAAAVAVRDTKDREAGPVLTFGAGEWRRFLGEVKRGG